MYLPVVVCLVYTIVRDESQFIKINCKFLRKLADIYGNQVFCMGNYSTFFDKKVYHNKKHQLKIGIIHSLFIFP